MIEWVEKTEPIPSGRVTYWLGLINERIVAEVDPAAGQEGYVAFTISDNRRFEALLNGPFASVDRAKRACAIALGFAPEPINKDLIPFYLA